MAATVPATSRIITMINDLRMRSPFVGHADVANKHTRERTAGEPCVYPNLHAEQIPKHEYLVTGHRNPPGHIGTCEPPVGPGLPGC